MARYCSRCGGYAAGYCEGEPEDAALCGAVSITEEHHVPDDAPKYCPALQFCEQQDYWFNANKRWAEVASPRPVRRTVSADERIIEALSSLGAVIDAGRRS